MRIEDVNPELRALGEEIFQFVEQLTGSRPVEHGGRGRYVASRVRQFLYIHFVGPHGRDRKNCVVLRARWHGDLQAIGAERGNNLYGQESASVTAQPCHVAAIARAKEFVQQAYVLDGR